MEQPPCAWKLWGWLKAWNEIHGAALFRTRLFLSAAVSHPCCGRMYFNHFSHFLAHPQLFTSTLSDAAQNQPNTLLCPTTDSNSWGNFVKDQHQWIWNYAPFPVTTGSALGMYSDSVQTNDVPELKKSVSCGNVRLQRSIQTGEQAFLEQKENTVSSGFKKCLELRHWRVRMVGMLCRNLYYCVYLTPPCKQPVSARVHSKRTLCIIQERKPSYSQEF